MSQSPVLMASEQLTLYLVSLHRSNGPFCYCTASVRPFRMYAYVLDESAKQRGMRMIHRPRTTIRIRDCIERRIVQSAGLVAHQPFHLPPRTAVARDNLQGGSVSSHAQHFHLCSPPSTLLLCAMYMRILSPLLSLSRRLT